LHELLLAELHAADQLEWERAIADSSHLQAKKGARKQVPSPVDRGRAGSKHHLLETAAASRLPGRSPAATATMSPSCSSCSTEYRRFAAGSVGRDGDRGR
jgi:hypothetical protein